MHTFFKFTVQSQLSLINYMAHGGISDPKDVPYLFVRVCTPRQSRLLSLSFSKSHSNNSEALSNTIEISIFQGLAILSPLLYKTRLLCLRERDCGHAPEAWRTNLLLKSIGSLDSSCVCKRFYPPKRGFSSLLRENGSQSIVPCYGRH